MSPVRLLVFDIDDTLYLERDYVRSGFLAVDEHVRSRHGATGFFDAAWQAFQTGLRRTIFDEVLVTLNLTATPEMLGAMVDAYRGHVPVIDLLGDARQSLDALAGRVKMAAISDGPLASQQAKATALGLSRWCQPIILTESLGPGLGKPHPAAFERVQSETGCRGSECVYLADNPTKDFHAPKQLGWRTLRIRRPGGLHHALESQLPVDAEWTDLSLLPQWVNDTVDQ